MQRLLLIMTASTYRAGAFMAAAEKLGVAVTVGSDQPQALAAANPGGFVAVTSLAPAVGFAVLRDFCQRNPCQAVIAAEDEGVALASTLAAELGIPHHPTVAVQRAQNKYLTRQAQARAGMLIPAFKLLTSKKECRNAARDIGYPCVLKPLHLSASRGVIRVDNPAEFAAAFARIVAIVRQTSKRTKPAQIIAEAFVPGSEYALEGLLVQGELKVLAIFDKPDPLDGPFFEESIYVTPSRLQQSVQTDLIAIVKQGITAIGLTHGPIHAELRVNEHGVWLLEIAPRSIGGLCSQVLRFTESTTLEELLLRHALGEDVTSIERESPAAGVMMIPIPQRGYLHGVSGVDAASQINGVEEVRITIPLGQLVLPLPEGSRYLGFIFARHASPAQVEAALRRAHENLSFDIRMELSSR